MTALIIKTKRINSNRKKLYPIIYAFWWSRWTIETLNRIRCRAHQSDHKYLTYRPIIRTDRINSRKRHISYESICIKLHHQAACVPLFSIIARFCCSIWFDDIVSHFFRTFNCVNALQIDWFCRQFPMRRDILCVRAKTAWFAHIPASPWTPSPIEAAKKSPWGERKKVVNFAWCWCQHLESFENNVSGWSDTHFSINMLWSACLRRKFYDLIWFDRVWFLCRWFFFFIFVL